MEKTPEPKPLIQSAPETLDVEQIMAEIRIAVEEKRRAGIYDAELPQLSSFLRPGSSALGLDDQINLLAASAQLDLDGDPISSHRPVSGPFIVAFKKFFRLWTRKYTDGLFLRQSHFNTEAVATIRDLRREVENLRREVAELRDSAASRK